MKKLQSILRKADKDQRSMIKFQLAGFGVMIIGITLALLGNSFGGVIGQIILISGIGLAIIGGLVVAPSII